MNIIGMAGRAGAGKDTAADILVAEFGFVKVALADPMKRACMAWFRWPADTLWGPSENRNYPWTKLGGLTARKALQTLGTEFGRECYPNVWADYAMDTAVRLLGATAVCPYAYDPTRGAYRNDSQTWRRPTGVVISDVRFPNEVGVIQQLGGQVWLVDRPLPDVPFWTWVRSLVRPKTWRAHKSETALDGMRHMFNRILDNSSTLHLYRDHVRSIAHRKWPDASWDRGSVPV